MTLQKYEKYLKTPLFLLCKPCKLYNYAIFLLYLQQNFRIMANNDDYAEKNGISKEMLQIARKYALSIVFHTHGFTDFAMSMMDYLGEDICCICKELY